ncbi:hypothetical protein HG536_0A01300 [Torulaspora globosa]|uniref:Suppressor of lethality of kex2 gas1 double null mutant n=1 Tax=Torulaspora globosa TaxID=48254 RepID=A0A7G3Z9X7_9SACH|nr:uncharacterized protein HG536_0A01300 [Torulaspora globosa]QLL30313.1 hypothetical protein HG536_0A01300 [Torulaspora globosa]
MLETKVMSATRTSLAGTYTVVKREAQSSGSSTSSGKVAKCTGSESSCQKPSNTSAVTVGVAVAIPVGCVLILFVVILWVVYRRNKKEAQEDNDPDFEGDTEYLPAAKGTNGYSLSTSSHSGDSQTPKEWAGDEESYFAGNSGRYLRGSESVRNSQARNVDPFILPEANDDSLRDFARQLQNDEFGPYRIASNSNSRATSQLSLPLEKNPMKVSSNVGSNVTRYTSADTNHTLGDATPTGDSTSSSEPPLNQSPVKSVTGDVTRKYAEDHSGLEAEHSKFDSTLDNQNSHTRPTETSHDNFNFEAREVLNQLDDSASPGEARDDDRVISLSAKEEEDIRRMKSVYKVYLDRNGTVKQRPFDESELQDDEEEQEAMAQSSNISETNAGTQLRVASDSHRVASSIYSAPPPQSYPAQETQLNPENYYTDHSPTSQQYSNQPQNVAPYGYAQSYEQQQQYPPQHYPMQFSQQHQYAHPQTLETIGELPTPTNLPFSTSSHSLTSFRQKSKQPQIAQLQTARINGTAVNPMDHPEMFYAQGNDSYTSYQTANGSVVSQPAAPYQLRQSVVMTNPSDLTAAPRFRPAGSIRTASAANTRNNTITSRMNPYYQQQQAYNLRVSGLLNEADVTQPPSVGQILPHSGSNEDLRRQIGGSHNYNVV